MQIPPLFAVAVLASILPTFAQGKLNTACDDMIITDSLLLPQAQRLADYRNTNTSDEVEKPAS